MQGTPPAGMGPLQQTWLPQLRLMEVLVSGLGDASMAVVSPAMVLLVQQVCAASRHGSDGAEVIRVVTGLVSAL